jgi:hypothetical protein
VEILYLTDVLSSINKNAKRKRGNCYGLIDMYQSKAMANLT